MSVIKKDYLKFFALCFLVLACNLDERGPEVNVGEVTGLRPIYSDPEVAKKIETLPPRGLENPGKIYAKGDWLLVNEIAKGLHVIDNSDPHAPKVVSFISIPGNIDMAVKGNILYADNYTDLVAIDISDLGNVKVTSRIENAFGNSLMFPLETGVYFECVDNSKGMVIGWEEATLMNPECYR